MVANSMNSGTRTGIRRGILPWCLPHAGDSAPSALLPGVTPSAWLEWTHAHCVTAIVHDNCVSHGVFGQFDASTQAFMEHYSFQCSLAYTRNNNTVRHIFERAHNSGLEIILLKGLSVAHRFYKKPMCRPSCDVDILVREKDRGKARSLLEELSYSMDRSEEEYTRRWQKCERMFIQRDPDLLPVELHWNVVNSPSLRRNLRYDEDAVFAGCTDMTLPDGLKIRIMREDALFVYLCVHLAFEHQIGKLLWCVDIQQMINSIGGSLDDCIAEVRARGGGERLAVQSVLAVLSSVFPRQTGFALAASTRSTGTDRLLSLILAPEDLLLSEGGGNPFRRKLFREALKYFA